MQRFAAEFCRQTGKEMARRMGMEAGMNGTIETNGRTEANGIMKANGITGTNGMRAVLTVSRGGLDKEACERSVGAFGRWVRERFNEVSIMLFRTRG